MVITFTAGSRAPKAQRTGVELTLIQPSGATAEEFYTRRTYDLAVLGSYHQIGEFLTRVGSLPRIITPTDLNLSVVNEESRSGAPQLEGEEQRIDRLVPPPQAALYA